MAADFGTAAAAAPTLVVARDPIRRSRRIAVVYLHPLRGMVIALHASVVVSTVKKQALMCLSSNEEGVCPLHCLHEYACVLLR